MNGRKRKTSYRAFHASGIKTDKEGLPCKSKKQKNKPKERAWSVYGKKNWKLYPYPICKCFCHSQGPLALEKKHIYTSLPQPKLVNWSFPKINIPTDRGHRLPEIASVRGWVPKSPAPRGRLCHFIRVITSRVVSVWVPSAPSSDALWIRLFSHQAWWLWLWKPGT